jgi:hypothetical protein
MTGVGVAVVALSEVLAVDWKERRIKMEDERRTGWYVWSEDCVGVAEVRHC